MTRIRKLDRREFLKLGATAGGGLLLGVAFSGPAAEAAVLGLDGAPDGFQPNAFVRVDPDGGVTIWLGKADMGQGVRTTLPMIVADELDADWRRVTVLQADAHPNKYGRMMTVGSGSVRNGAWMDLRRAGAAARAMLVAAAATRMGVPASELTTSQGTIMHRGSGRTLGYGDLAAAAAALPVPQDPPLKARSDWRLMGTPVPLLDTADKVTGRATYGIDVRVPGMLFATVVKPSILGGSLPYIDASDPRQIPGVRHVVPIASGAAVVATNTWAAFEGAAAMGAPSAGSFRMSSDDISRHHHQLLDGDAVVARSEGDAAAALARASRTVEAVYEVPYLAHATMEPMNCTAHVTADRCEVWAPTQNPQGAQASAARITGLPLEKVTVHVTYLGCGWGRRGLTDYVDDAVETSKKVGAPVQVLWTRETDMHNDAYRPGSVIRFQGAVEGGRIGAFRARVAGPPLGVTDQGGRTPSGPDRNAVDGVVSMTYAIPDLLVDYCRSDVQVPTGYWRSVGPSGNCFMVEGFVDELAHAAGQDPLAFRLAHLDHHPRMKHALEKVAAMARWQDGAPAGRARGIGIVEDKGGIVAQIAEVSLDGDQVRVHRVWCAADCGTVIHPGVVDAQITGSIVGGLTAALYGEITIEGGRVVQDNFDTYKMLRMNEMPRIEVHLVPSTEEPGGVGEPALPPIAPAVANALFALTGKRIRRLPIRLAEAEAASVGGAGRG